ncbi:MAG: thioredoxin family protein [Ideonella sp.]
MSMPLIAALGPLRAAVAGCLLLTGATTAWSTAPPPAEAKEAAGIAWVHASGDSEVDAAFAQAKAEKKPLFLYWGAKWCPPCNQVKATLFNRQEFIARSRAFVPVYIDGDKPGAQKLGSRFKVRGYPTMVLFNADGTELTRLPGEVGAHQYTEVLSLGMAARRPIKAVLADARDKARSLSLDANEWRMLAFYSWETDERQLVTQGDTPSLLKQLAANCPASQRETADRLLLQSLAAQGDGKPALAAKAADSAVRERIGKLLDDPRRSRAQMDLLGNQAAELMKALSPSGSSHHQQLLARFDAALARLAADESLSRADRLTAQVARVDLARIGLDKGAKPVIAEKTLQSMRQQVERDDREITDGYERQAVITTGAYLLAQAGLMAESDQLLVSNLAKSHSPYYLMSALASNARQRGDNVQALRWYAQAHARSDGTATRLQWGASYLAALVDLAPRDAASIEKVAREIFNDAATQPDAFYERSGRSLQKVSGKLLTWAKTAADDQQAEAVVGRLQKQVDGICAKLPSADPSRSVCEGLLKPGGDGKST